MKLAAAVKFRQCGVRSRMASASILLATMKALNSKLRVDLISLKAHSLGSRVSLIPLLLFAHVSLAENDALFGLPAGQRIRPEVSAYLGVPYKVLLGTEYPHLYFAVKNDSGAPIELPGDTSTNSESQFLCQARDARGNNLTKPQSFPDWVKVMDQLAYCDQLQLPPIVVNSGEHKIFKYAEGRLTFYYDIIPAETDEIRFGILIGANEWVFSDWEPVRRLVERPVEDEIIVGNLERSPSNFYPLRRARIDGADYLFMNNTRIACLPDGWIPSFSQSNAGRVFLTVHFGDYSLPDLVTDVGIARAVKWTPATAPHAAAYDALIARLKQNNPPDAVETKPQSLPPSAPAASTAPQPAPLSAPPASREPPPPRPLAFSTRTAILAIIGLAFLCVMVGFSLRRQAVIHQAGRRGGEEGPPEA